MAILALLLGTTLSMVWHHHADSTASSDNCPICHISHQAVDTPAVAVRLCAPVPTGPGVEPQYLTSPSASTPRFVPARGPPAA
ncbi:MAG TPA: hypothetical protein VFC39_10745 [Acidobacteriaceae bacterium]|nr:hypothetical protein [Acidobacteriaceae bacterium]